MNNKNNINSFNPLESNNTELQLKALKKFIQNLLTCYNGWYDPFCEAIQNALDSIDQRCKDEKQNYQPSIWITINLKENYFIVTDNGIGLDEEKFKTFLQPNVTLKDKGYRGHKGVGATYLAYGFNDIQICTKNSESEIIASMKNAKKWVDDDDSSLQEFPYVEINNNYSNPKDKNFQNVDQGVSICVHCCRETRPRDLSWIQVKDAKTWFNILRIKTGLGAIEKQDNVENIKIYLEVTNKNNKKSYHENIGIGFLWIHELPLNLKSAKLSEIIKKRDSLHKKHKDTKDLKLYGGKLRDLEIIYDFYEFDELIKLIEDLEWREENQEIKDNLLTIIKEHRPYTYCCYTYSSSFWEDINKKFEIRNSLKIFKSGIQLATNYMPQGEIHPIDYKSVNADRTYIVIHFNNCQIDLGRQSFSKDLVDFSQEIASILVNEFSRYRKHLKENTGKKDNFFFQNEEVEKWKEKLTKHSDNNPLTLDKYEIPMLSKPAKEQDVVALFNQFLGAKIINGIKIMSTDQKFTYDCLCRYKINDLEEYIFESTNNSLGISEEFIKSIKDKYNDLPLISSPKVLEYKFSIDGLIEDLKDREKNSSEIDILVAWETGNKWKETYSIMSLLDQDNIHYRKYHGVTHILFDRFTNEEKMFLIVLEELMNFLNNPEEEQERQKEKYES